MKLYQLQYYVEVVRQKSFTHAAEKLYISQSALSKSIQALEQSFQISLINRTVREFSLTAEGQLFYDYAVKVLRFVDAETRALRQQLHHMDGSLDLGLPPTAGSIYFYALLNQFKKAYPNIQLNLTEVPSTVIFERLEAHQLDMGVVLEPFRNDQYISRAVCRSEIVLTVSAGHPLAARESVDFSELQGEKFLMMSADFMFHNRILELCREAGFAPTVVFESSQWDLIYEMTIDNQGISFFPRLLLEKFQRTQARQIRLDHPSAYWTLSVAYRKDRFLTSAMKCFLNMCPAI